MAAVTQKRPVNEAQLDGWTFLAPNNNGKKDDEDEEVDLTRIYIYIYIYILVRVRVITK